MLFAVPAALAQPTVSAVRVGEHPDKTRFVMELSEAPRYRVSLLADPARVAIDLPELVWAPSGKLRDRDGLIRAVRLDPSARGTSRVVLDVTAPVRVGRVFVLPPGSGHAHRFVLDVVPASREDFLAGVRGEPIDSRPPLTVAAVPPAQPVQPTQPPQSVQPPARAAALPAKPVHMPIPRRKPSLLVAQAPAQPAAAQQIAQAPPPPPKLGPAPTQAAQTGTGAASPQVGTPLRTDAAAEPPPLSALAQELMQAARASERTAVAEAQGGSPPPPAEQQTAPQTQTAALPTVGVLAEQVSVMFQEGSAELSDGAKDQLETLARQLSQQTSTRIRVAAYAKSTDDRPARARRLSLSRALAVRTYLIDQGVRSTRMDVRALGAKVPDGPPDRVDIVPLDAKR